MPGKEAKEYRIIDNKSGEYAQWSDALIPELKEFRSPELVAEFFPDLTQEFPELMIPQTVEQKDIDKAKENLGSHFDNENADRMSKLLKLICPDCGHEYYLSRGDVLNNPSMCVS